LGIIAAIAIPAYQDYSIRAKVSEAINVSAAAKAAVSDYYWANNVWPSSRLQAGASEIDTKFITTLSVLTGGVISLDIDETATGLSAVTSESMYILLTPRAVTGSFDWFCSSNNAVDGSGDNLVVGRFAPATCR